MNNYKEYLQKDGYAESSITLYLREVNEFTKWCKTNHTTAYQIDYKGCLKYIKYLQRKNVTKRTVSLQLCCVKKYLHYLVVNNNRANNPIADTTIKGVKRIINYDVLDADELEDLYYSYPTISNKNYYEQYVAKRDKVILGLLVYQGLDSNDIKQLQIEHLQIHKGKVYVPSRKRSNARELELKPWQIMECMEYINEVRKVLVKRLKNYDDTGQLFPYGGAYAIVKTIVDKTKKYNAKVVNSKHIRASVITNWLLQYNLRKVQYLAGHRYISSTERYLQDDLENLHEIVNNYHPIN